MDFERRRMTAGNSIHQFTFPCQDHEFPFPEPTDAEWTRTEVLEFPGSADGPWKRYIDPATIVPTRDTLARSASEGMDVPADFGPRSRFGLVSGIGTVRYPRIVARDEECAKQLKKRTLTNLYNERPTWLDLAHRKLDEAVFSAYGWDARMGDEQLLGRLLELNLERASH